MAEIRREERESWAGPDLAPLRREMEKRLGLSLTEDEKWRPRKVLLWVFPPLLVIAAAVLLPARRRFSAVTSAKNNGYKIRIILIAAAALALILLMELPGGGAPGILGNRAVLEKTPAYRVPETEGALSALFNEGQPVHIGASRGGWVYAESADGRAGWVPSASVIQY
jgi:hypothetical protein